MADEAGDTATAEELEAIGSLLTDEAPAEDEDASKDAAKPAEESGDKPVTELTKDDKDEPGKDAAAEKDEDGEADKSKDSTPETYETFSVPEGVEIDEAVLADFLPLLKGVNATQEQAQAFIDLKVKADQEYLKTQEQTWADTQKAWREAAETDKDYGGASYAANIAIARDAVERIGGSALKTALVETGMGNHPELIRAFIRIGEAIKEDGVSFGSPTGGDRTQAQILFPDQN